VINSFSQLSGFPFTTSFKEEDGDRTAALIS